MSATKPIAPPAKPLALIVDDDPDHNRMMEVILRKLGVATRIEESAKAFLEALKTVKPSICLVDLNLDDLGVGFTLIKAVRNVLGPGLPIIVLSGHADRQAVAHAVEVGANDFVAKPIDKAVLTSKLTRYLVTEELLLKRSAFFPVPEGGAQANIVLDFALREVDEFGIKIVSRHLLNKGSVFRIDSPLIYELTGSAEPHLFTVTATSIEPNGEDYAAFCEFDHSNEDVVMSVRRWLSKHSN